MKTTARRALGELVLIFVGITLALAFENWNAERVERQREARLLADLADDLRVTLEEARLDGTAAQTQFDAIVDVLDWMNGTSLGEDTLGNRLAGVQLSVRLFPKRSAYESIKSIGLDLIEDSEVRTAVTAIYELSIPRALQFDATTARAREERVGPYLAPHVRYTGPPGTSDSGAQIGPIQATPLSDLRPRDPPSLRQDETLRILLRSYGSEVGLLRGMPGQLETEIESALTLLEAD